MIYITQCKCLHNHAIMALAWEGKEEERPTMEREFKEDLEEVFASGLLNPWCGLCMSREFHYDTHRTIWGTLEEAMPHLYESEFAQRLTAAVQGPINAAKRKAGH